MKTAEYYIPRAMPTYKVEPRNRPYDREAYLKPIKPTFGIPNSGFPTAPAPVRPWIPGLSTPEGIIIVASASTAVINTISNGSEAVLHAAQSAISLILVAVIGGIPTGAIWIGTRLFAHH